jgi:hypothetical protein
LVVEASSLLRGTGLFEPDEIEHFDLYNEYKRGFPRLRPSSWITPSCALVLFSDRRYGLNPLHQYTVARNNSQSNPAYSTQIVDLIPSAEIYQLPMPRLPSLFSGFCHRFLESHDDVAMMAAEQLVDGMDLDEGWCQRNLRTSSPEVFKLANRLVVEKRSRLDDFSENTVTCFIPNDKEAARVRRIPGYE